MKILNCIRTVNPELGGTVEAVNQLSKALQRQSHQVEIASLDLPTDSFVSSYPGTLHPLGENHRFYGYSKRWIPWLRLNRYQYDIILIHGLWQYHSFGTWRELKKGDTPYVVYPHGMLDPWFKRTYPLKHLKKWLYWPWAEYRVLRDSRAVLFTAEDERIGARQSFSLYRCKEIVVNLGIETPPEEGGLQKTAFLMRFPELRGKRFVLFLGRIHPKKGCDDLIEAFSKIALLDADLYLVMAGPDPLDWRNHLERVVVSDALRKRIVWTGMIRGDEKWGAFRSAEVFILPSHQENFGIAVVEALACHLPVLISNKVNIWREIEEFGAGFSDRDDAEGCRKLLAKWLELTSEKKELMRRKGHECFLKKFQMGETTTRLVNVLCSEIGRRES